MKLSEFLNKKGLLTAFLKECEKGKMGRTPQSQTLNFYSFVWKNKNWEKLADEWRKVNQQEYDLTYEDIK